MLEFVSLVVLIIGGLVFGVEALRGELRGTGLKFVAICGGVASLLLLFQNAIRQKLISGTASQEGMTVDADFTDFKLNGKIKGIILN